MQVLLPFFKALADETRLRIIGLLAARAHTVEQLGTVLVILRFLGGNLLAAGPLTGKGRQRAATTAYLQTLDRFMRLAQTVGLERVAKQVVNPADWLEGKG